MCAIGLAIAVFLHMSLPWIASAAACLLSFSYAWEYSAHAFKQVLWAPLNHLQRRQYGQVWDSLATSPRVPEVAAADVSDEEDLGPSTLQCVQNLSELVSLGPDDDVLEIGCGAGRIGLAIAPRCRLWTGVDISPKMLAYASDRLGALKNVRLFLLRKVGLEHFSGNSFDVVYATSTFGHLDEMDRFRYVEEAARVLRPGGRLLLDNIDIESDPGWTMFVRDAKRYQDLERPPYMPRFSTASELMTYARRAGLERLGAHRRGRLVVLTAMKGVRQTG